MTAFLRRALGALFLSALASTSLAADRTIIVLDASGSMWGQIDGKPKLEVARETLRSVLRSLPADMELGLMAYGHREKGACTDIELVVPPATGTASAITQAADSMKFLGKTPLTAAVRQAAEALKYTEEKSTVVLITDGVETCEADPCALGRELEQAGVDFTAHVVGFGLTAEEGREVACLAETTGGKYWQASDASGLTEALTATVASPPEPAPDPAPDPAPAPEPVVPAAPEPAPPAVAEPAQPPAEPALPAEPAKPAFNVIPDVVMKAGGEPLKGAGNAWEIFKADADGSRGEPVAIEYDTYKGDLAPGDYVIIARLGLVRVEQKLKVEAGKVYTPVFVLDAGTLVVKPRASAGGEVSSDATVLVEYPGGSMPATNYGETKIVLPAGEQRLTVKLGSGEITETLQLAAGQTVEKDLVVGIGHVTVNALYAPGGEQVEASGLDVKIFKAKPRIDGSREQVTYRFGPDAKFDLSPGDHVAAVKLDQAEVEVPFTIAAGETKQVTAVLDAGVLSVTAPGARSIKVFAAEKDAQGERKQFGYGFDGKHQATLPAGSYVVETDRQDGSPPKETPVIVSAGGRIELTIQ
jgi:Ca-activated chloride channel family protein